jgi:hypothetical protein
MTTDQRESIRKCLQLSDLTAWESEFLRGIDNSGDEYQLSQKQQAALDRIDKKRKSA